MDMDISLPVGGSPIDSRSPAVIALGLGIMLVSLAVPLIADPFLTSVGVSIIFGIVIAASWNIFSGFTGYINLGHALFIGVGAFTSGHPIRAFGIGESLGIGLIAVLLASGLASFVIGLVISIPLLRLQGYYFALATLAAAEVARAVFRAVGPLRGLQGITMPSLRIEGSMLAPGDQVYYIMYVIMAITLVGTYVIRHSKLGYGFRAIQLGENAAEMLGVPTRRYTILAFGISGFFAGMAGGAYAYHLAYFTSSNVFPLELTLEAVVITLLGGIGTIIGPIIGALIIVSLDDFVLTSFTTQGKFALTGVILMFILLVAPDGILSAVRARLDRSIRGEDAGGTDAGGETDE